MGDCLEARRRQCHDCWVVRMSKVPMVRSVWPRVIVRDLRKHGKDVERILGESGLDLRTINREEGRIPWEKQAHLMEIVARELGDDCYGLHLSAKVDVRDAGALGYLGLASRTLGDALSNLERYVQTFTEAGPLNLFTNRETAVVQLNPAVQRYHQQAEEFGAGLLIHAYRFFTKRNITPVEVRFRHSRRDKLREVTRFFGCRVKYQQKHLQIALKLVDLTIPIATADDRLLRILQAHCQSTLKNYLSQTEDLLQKVQRRVMDLLPKGQAKAKIIAIDLGMSDRTFTRRISETGTSFNEIVDELRQRLALKYVLETELNLAEIAFLLGYSNQPAFNRALKRWNGKPPSDMRAPRVRVTHKRK